MDLLLVLDLQSFVPLDNFGMLLFQRVELDLMLVVQALKGTGPFFRSFKAMLERNPKNG